MDSDEPSAVDVEVDGDCDLVVARQEHAQRERVHIKAGYVEGAVAGHVDGVNEGFSAGLVSGVQCAIPWAVIRGRTQALITLCQGDKQILKSSCDLVLAERRLTQLLGDIKAKEVCQREQCLSADRLQYETTVDRQDGVGLVQGQCLLRNTLESCQMRPALVEASSQLDALVAEFQLT